MELLLEERYEAEKMAERFRGNQYTSVRESGAGQNGPREEHRHQTRQKIADEAGVSEAAIKRYAQFAKDVAVAEYNAAKKEMRELLIYKANVERILGLDEQDKEKIRAREREDR